MTVGSDSAVDSDYALDRWYCHHGFTLLATPSLFLQDCQIDSAVGRQKDGSYGGQCW